MTDSADRSRTEPTGAAELWEQWLRAWGLRAPLSGDVTQDIETSLIRRLTDQLGFINISLDAAGDPQLERRIVEDVASYGRQLGRVLDVLDVLVRSALPADLEADDRRVVEAFAALRRKIASTRTSVAAERVDRLVRDIEVLKRDSQGDPAVLERLRQALGDG